MPEARYAIYFAPPPSASLWQFAARWLGRDAVTGESFPLASIDGVPAALREAMIASPRRYGFHATLKPPFHLAGGRTEPELITAVTLLARTRRRFVLPPLRLATLGNFLALTLSEPSAQLDDLANHCVRDLDLFRRQPSPEELARRQPERLTPRQVELLRQWGYPYVFDQWKFHMTLTSSLDDEAERTRAFSVLSQAAGPLLAQEPLVCDALCVFVQEQPGEPFLLRHRLPFSHE